MCTCITRNAHANVSCPVLMRLANRFEATPINDHTHLPAESCGFHMVQES